jgi:formamidopyrimidine-DNA glycosylase
MPELPEVETVRRRLQRTLRGRRIVRVQAASDPVVFDVVAPSDFAHALEGARVQAAHRKGKHLWLALDRRPWPLFHFGMTGWIHVDRKAAVERRFAKLIVDMDDGTRVVYTDPRRFGRIRLQDDPPQQPPVSLLGFDPLEGVPPVVELRRLLARRNAPTKAVLLDQSVFAGVGNWVADEVLFQARIAPQRPASSLTVPEARALRTALLRVVQKAVAVGADDAKFPRAWLFHHRWGKNAAALTSRGDRIVHETIGGRTTAWVPKRQK